MRWDRPLRSILLVTSLSYSPKISSAARSLRTAIPSADIDNSFRDIEISWHNISLRMGMPNCYDPQSPRRIDETRRSRFLLLGCCSLLRCNNRAAFLLRCSRPCLFLRRLLLRRLWRFVAHMLKLPSLAWQTRALNRPTFGIAPLTFAPQPCLNIN